MGKTAMTSGRKPVIGVMGGAKVTEATLKAAFELGVQIAEKGWMLLNGGRDAGVMRASAHGAKSKGGTTIGILPGASADQANRFIDVAIVTNMGDARNVINVLSSDVVVVFPGGAGTLSEAALAIKSHRPVIVFDKAVHAHLARDKAAELYYARGVDECIEMIEELVRRH